MSLWNFLESVILAEDQHILYKDGKGKLTMGPVWDFNNAMDNFFLKQPTDTMQFHDLYWYRMLLKDEDFVNKVIHRYEQFTQNCIR